VSKYKVFKSFWLLVLLFSGIILFAESGLYAHPWKAKHFVVIDTDCGFDDLRAICLMLASPEIKVLAITTSNGVLDAVSGYSKVKGLLNDLNHQGILVGADLLNPSSSQECKPAINLRWGDYSDIESTIPGSLEIVEYIMNNANNPVSFVNLGSLSAIGNYMDAGILEVSEVKEIIWSTSIDYTGNNLNYQLDTLSYNKVSEGIYPFKMINASMNSFYSDIIINEISLIKGGYAKKILQSVKGNLTDYQTAFFDEATLFYMHSPEYFVNVNALSNSLFVPDTNIDVKKVFYSTLLSILNDDISHGSQVFDGLPMDISLYSSDVQVIMQETVERYGKAEWRAMVLGNEFHRHMGVYAVIGVKMGIRALDYFGAGIDDLNITSYAGSVTPISCLNDGLQASTGATIGHGLIKVEQEGDKYPGAGFEYMNRNIIILLKDEYKNIISSEISEYNKIYGLNSDIYWELVRMAAIKYWESWDRNDIFTITIPDN